MAKNWTTDEAIKLDDKISIETNTLPVEIKGEFVILRREIYDSER